jgi:hypothetical protein
MVEILEEVSIATLPVVQSTSPVATTTVAVATTSKNEKKSSLVSILTFGDCVASGVGCIGLAPLGAVCVNGVWEVTGDVNITTSASPIDLNNKTVLVLGNLTFSSNTTLLVTPTSILNVTGCVFFSGNVQLTIDPSTTQDGSSLTVITSNSSCASLASNLSAPTIVYPNGAASCKEVEGTYFSDGISVSVLLTVKNTCSKKVREMQ